jgi:hypothetical protein
MKKLEFDELYGFCDPDILPFATTDELPEFRETKERKKRRRTRDKKKRRHEKIQ